MTEVELHGRILKDKLQEFGFQESDGGFRFEKPIVGGRMRLELLLAKDEKLLYSVRDVDSGDEYFLHLVKSASGEFVGRVRSECQSVIDSFTERCLDDFYFKREQTRQVRAYVKEVHDDEFEFLWDDHDAAIFRRKDNRKWYGIVMEIHAKKLGLSDEGLIEILNVKINPMTKESLVDGRTIFPAYHMNKKSWVTLVLDGRLPFESITSLIEESYRLAGMKK